MKKIVFIVLIFLLNACDEKKTSTSEKTDATKAEKVVIKNTSDKKITLLNIEELQQLLHKKNDTTYVVNFWATWCRPCIKELPYFEELSNSYRSEKVKVILVSIDDPAFLKRRVLPFVKNKKLNSDVYLVLDKNVNFWMHEISSTWNGTIPVTIFFNKNSRRFFEKSFSYKELNQELISLLNN